MPLYLQQFDTVLIAMPLYIYAVPGVVMKLLEQMTPVQTEGKSIGFIVQSGFVEGAQSDYLVRYLQTMEKHFEETGAFDPEIVRDFQQPYALSKGQAHWNDFLFRIGVGNLFWYSMLKKNDTFDKKLARPFAPPF